MNFMQGNQIRNENSFFEQKCHDVLVIIISQVTKDIHEL